MNSHLKDTDEYVPVGDGLCGHRDVHGAAVAVLHVHGLGHHGGAGGGRVAVPVGGGVGVGVGADGDVELHRGQRGRHARVEFCDLALASLDVLEHGLLGDGAQEDVVDHVLRDLGLVHGHQRRLQLDGVVHVLHELVDRVRVGVLGVEGGEAVAALQTRLRLVALLTAQDARVDRRPRCDGHCRLLLLLQLNWILFYFPVLRAYFYKVKNTCRRFMRASSNHHRNPSKFLLLLSF